MNQSINQSINQIIILSCAQKLTRELTNLGLAFAKSIITTLLRNLKNKTKQTS